MLGEISRARVQRLRAPYQPLETLRLFPIFSPRARLHLAFLLVWGVASLALLALPLFNPRAGNDDNRSILPQNTVAPARRAVPFVVQEEGLTLDLSSSQRTVGEALIANGILLEPQDIVIPSPNIPLSSGLHVIVERLRSIDLTVARERNVVFSRARTVGQLLAELGIVPGPQDRLTPPADTRLRSGLEVELVAVIEVTEVAEEIIPPSTIYEYDDNLESGKGYVFSTGRNGLIRREYRVLYEDGQEVSRTLVSETYQPPSQRIVVRSTATPSLVPVGDCRTLSHSRSLVVYATWYNALSAGGSGITATGVRLDYGIVAVDPKIIPLGTRLCIPGYGIGIAADTGGGVMGNMVDLGFPGAFVPNWESRFLEIYILD